MPAIAFSDLDQNLQPVPGWRFYVTLPDIPGVSTQGQVLSFLVERFLGTNYGIDYEQAPFQAGLRNFPTGHHLETITVQFAEDQKLDVIQYLSAWQALIIDSNGNYGLPARYKQAILVDSLDEQGNVLGTFGWQYCSPVRPDAYEFDGSHTKHLSASCSFAVDDVIPLSNLNGARATVSGSTSNNVGNQTSINLIGSPQTSVA